MKRLSFIGTGSPLVHPLMEEAGSALLRKEACELIDFERLHGDPALSKKGEKVVVQLESGKKKEMMVLRLLNSRQMRGTRSQRTFQRGGCCEEHVVLFLLHISTMYTSTAG